jgi:serine/threonine protein phosphatase 1
MPEARTFVIGDIHGSYTALMQCLALSEFDYQQDELIALGDVCDGWPETAQCIDELLKIKRLIYVLGNHDLWALEWARNREAPEIWLEQGGKATVDGYPQGMPATHQKLLAKAYQYYIRDQRIFVHAGILPDMELEYQGQDIFLWDRSLCRMALQLKQEGKEQKIGSFEEIYLGHTPTTRWGYFTPFNACNVWMMDTGAAWNGCLSIMNIQTKKYFQSDPVWQLYPGIKGR